MTYASDHVINALKTARQAKHLSQRRLSQTAGVPQSHLSKIEQGAVDLQLSSLIELARDLELELVLVPRRLVPAVEAILRSQESERSRAGASAARAVDEVRRLKDTLRRFDTHPGAAGDVKRLQNIVSELAHLPLRPKELEKLRQLSASFRKTEKGEQALPELRRATQELQRLRNNLVHNPAEEPSPARPAYALDGEDDDA